MKAVIENRSMFIPFPGFYESDLDYQINYEIESMAENAHENGDYPGATAQDICDAVFHVSDFGFHVSDFGFAQEKIAIAYAESFASNIAYMCKELEIVPFTMAWEKTDSPREYNFETDRCYVTIPLADIQRMFDATNGPDLREVIRERHSSRSGFISFYSNDADIWFAKPLADWDVIELSSLLLAFIRTAENACAVDHDTDNGIEQHITYGLISEGDNLFGDAIDASIDYDKLADRLRDVVADRTDV